MATEEKLLPPWKSYSQEELIGTYIALPRFLKIFRGWLQQIFGRRVLAMYYWSLSVGEIIFFIGSFGLLGLNVAANYGQDGPSGNAASILMLACLVFTTKNSLLCFICGLSYERAIFWHKLFGWAAVASGFLHFFSSATQLSGWILLGAMCGMLGFSLWPIRIFTHEIFMRLHWLGVIVVAVGAILHGVVIGIIGLGYWALDVAIKSFVIWRYSKNCSKVTIYKVNKEIVKLTLPSFEFPYSGGQYVCVCIPSISYFEWHPFSIHSSFGEKKLEIYFKASGNWTKNAMALAKQEGAQIDALISGPFGFPSIDLAGDYYQNIVLIGGGIGVTPIVSTCKDLLEQRKQGRPLNKILLIWTTKDTEKAEEILSIEYMNSLLSNEDRQKGLLEVYCHCSKKLDEENSQKGKKTKEGNQVQENTTEISNNQSTQREDTTDRTQGVLFQGQERENIERNEIQFVSKRPDIKDYLSRLQHECQQTKEKRIGVFVCGPTQLVRSAQRISRALSRSVVRIDVHEEVFDL